MKQSFDEFEKTEGKAEFFNSVGVRDVELEKEKWSMGEEKFNTLINLYEQHEVTKLANFIKKFK